MSKAARQHTNLMEKAMDTKPGLPFGKTLIIIPTYNESENINTAIDVVMGLEIQDLDILVVDDNSPDGTGNVVKNLALVNQHIKLIEREGKLGLGTAYVCGFKYAIAHNYDYVMEMDADLSHDPAMIPFFLKSMHDADLVIGSRYVGGETANVVNWPLRRLMLSRGASIYTRIITGLPVQDPTAGFKCFRRKVLETIDLDNIRSGGYSFQIEVNFKVWRKGFRIKEIPIVFIDRTVGKSKMSRKIIWEAIWMVWRLRLKQLLGQL